MQFIRKVLGNISLKPSSSCDQIHLQPDKGEKGDRGDIGLKGDPGPEGIPGFGVRIDRLNVSSFDITFGSPYSVPT